MSGQIRGPKVGERSIRNPNGEVLPNGTGYLHPRNPDICRNETHPAGSPLTFTLLQAFSRSDQFLNLEGMLHRLARCRLADH